MTVRFTYPRLAAGLAAGAIVALFLSGVAYAITSNVFRYSTRQAGSYSISPAEMPPASDDLDYTVSGDRLQLDSGTGCFATTVHLPEGARLTSVTNWYSATSAAAVTLGLERIKLGTGVEEVLIKRASTDSTGNRIAKSFPVPGPLALINNRAHAYVFFACLNDASAVFYGARINYTYREAGA